MSYRIVYFTHSLSILLKLIEVHKVSAAAQIVVIPSPTPTADIETMLKARKKRRMNWLLVELKRLLLNAQHNLLYLYVD